MKSTITEKKLTTLQLELSNLICEEQILSREEREDLVHAVAAVAAARARLEKVRAPTAGAKPAEEKKERIVDPRFPNAGMPWSDADDELLHSVIDPLPDDQVGNHVMWLAGKMGRTPYSVACKIVQGGRCSLGWRKPWKVLTEELRASGLDVDSFMSAREPAEKQPL